MEPVPDQEPSPDPKGHKHKHRSSAGRRRHHSRADKRIGTRGEYVLERTLGEGQFGKVKLATHTPSGIKVAVKIINKAKLGPESLRLVTREVAIMKTLQHPNIIQLYEVIETDDHMYIVMEHAAGGEVMDHILAHGRLKERDACRFFAQAAFAIQYCHTRHTVHRDLKAENILLDDSMNVKLIDFGLGNTFTPGKLLNTFCGSPTYASPELVQRHEYAGPEVDCWSLGVLLYVLVCGFLPFDGNSFVDLYQKIIEARYRIPGHVSPQCADLMRKILVPDVSKRATVDEIVQHEWITSQGHAPPLPLLHKRPTNASELSQVIVSDMVAKFGYNPEEILHSVLNDTFDGVAATYYLLHERRLRRSRGSGLGSITTPIPPQIPLSPHSSGQPQSSSKPLQPPAHPVFFNFTPSTSVPQQEPSSMSSPPEKTEGARALSPFSALAARKVRARSFTSDIVLPPKARSGSIESQSSNAAGLLVPTEQRESLTPASPPLSPMERVRGQARQRPRSSLFASLAPRRGHEILQETPVPPQAQQGSNAQSSSHGRRMLSMSSPRASRRMSRSETVGSMEEADSSSFAKRKISLNNFFSSMFSARKTHESSLLATASSTFPATAGSTGGPNSQSLLSPQQQAEPRAVRFAFSMKTTSTMPASEVFEELMRVLSETEGIRIEEPSARHPFLLRCRGDSGLHVEVEVCRIPRLSLRGVRFHRVSGDSWEYKNLCKDVLSQLRL